MALTPKQEAFARAYVETGNASEAYRRAYNVGSNTKAETINKRASELLTNGEVAGRVAELQAKAAERTMITVESLTVKLEEARLHALKDEKGASAAVSAIMGMAKLHGLLIDKQDHSSSDGSMSPKPTVIRIVAADDGSNDKVAAEAGADIQ